MPVLKSVLIQDYEQLKISYCHHKIIIKCLNKQCNDTVLCANTQYVCVSFTATNTANSMGMSLQLPLRAAVFPTSFPLHEAANKPQSTRLILAANHLPQTVTNTREEFENLHLVCMIKTWNHLDQICSRSLDRQQERIYEN